MNRDALYGQYIQLLVTFFDILIDSQSKFSNKINFHCHSLLRFFQQFSTIYFQY